MCVRTERNGSLSARICECVCVMWLHFVVALLLRIKLIAGSGMEWQCVIISYDDDDDDDDGDIQSSSNRSTSLATHARVYLVQVTLFSHTHSIFVAKCVYFHSANLDRNLQQTKVICEHSKFGVFERNIYDIFFFAWVNYQRNYVSIFSVYLWQKPVLFRSIYFSHFSSVSSFQKSSWFYECVRFFS